MANLRSSKKDIRRSEKRKIANSQKKSAIRTLAKNLLKKIKSGPAEEAKTMYNEFASILDKAAKTKLIHKKNADRQKSRISLKIKTMPSN